MEQIEDFLSNIEEYFESKGIFLFDKDKKTLNINNQYLSLPSDITNVPPYELGEYLNALTQQKIYIRSLRTRFKVYKEQARRRYREAYDKKYKELTNCPIKYSEAAKEKLIEMDEEVRALDYECRDWDTKIEYLKDCMDSCDESIFLVSREITRRGIDFDNEKRSL